MRGQFERQVRKQENSNLNGFKEEKKNRMGHTMASGKQIDIWKKWNGEHFRPVDRTIRAYS